MNPNIQIKTVTLAANQTLRVDVTGSTVLFVSQVGTFEFGLDGGNYQPGLCIMAIDIRDIPSQLGSVTPPPKTAPQFNSILFHDTSGSANTITYIVANYPVTYINPQATYFFKNASTVPIPSGVKNLADGACSAAYSGINAGRTRKTFILSNLNGTPAAPAGSVAYVCVDNLGTTLGTPCNPQQSIVVETDGQLFVQNQTGSGALNYSVLELFYK